MNPYVVCIHCGGWGCRQCKPRHEVAASAGGEQGLSPEELEIQSLRTEAALLREELAQALRRLEQAHQAHASTARTVEQLAEAIALMAREMGRG